MDLGLQGRRAIVCAASKGLGRACAEALAAEGVDLVLNARSPAPLEQTASEIRTLYKVTVTAVAGDIASAEGRAADMAHCRERAAGRRRRAALRQLGCAARSRAGVALGFHRTACPGPLTRLSASPPSGPIP